MSIELTLLIAAVSCVLGIIGALTIAKRNNSSDGYNLGRIDTLLEQISKKVDNLDTKLSTNTAALYADIDKAVENHEKRYHNG